MLVVKHAYALPCRAGILVTTALMKSANHTRNLKELQQYSCKAAIKLKSL